MRGEYNINFAVVSGNYTIIYYTNTMYGTDIEECEKLTVVDYWPTALS